MQSQHIVKPKRYNYETHIADPRLIDLIDVNYAYDNLQDQSGGAVLLTHTRTHKIFVNINNEPN